MSTPAAAPAPATFESTLRHPAFRQGVRDMSGIALGIAAWGLVTGVAMVNSGMPVWAALTMSLTVFAGTAQLASAPLIASGAPIWVPWAAALALNLRFVIFSAQWRPYFAHLPRSQKCWMGYFSGDLNYVLFMRRYPEPRPQPDQLPYFWGCAATNAIAWHLASVVGILMSQWVPMQWGLGFAGTMALLGMTLSMLADRRAWLPTVVAGAAAVAAFGLPLKLHMLVAIAAAVVVGMVGDQFTAARRKAG